MAIISTPDFKTTLITAARFSFLLVGIASTAIIIASIMIPISTSLISTSLPQIRIIASTFLSPSHLFITVHFIIIAIWKLNKNNTHIHHHSLHQKPQYQEEEDDEEIQFQIKPPEIPCNVLPPDPISTAVDELGDTMDATWKTIVESDAAAAAGDGDGGGAAATTELARRKMRKSETWERCNNRECSPAAAAEGRFRKSKTFRRASVGRDELFGRAEAFIRTHYEQRRIQRQESEQRYVEMVNAAC